MTEKDAINVLLLELIGIHLKISNIGMNEKNTVQVIENAENIINGLNEEDRNIIRMYINNLTNQIADEEMCLYTAGVKDGIRLLNWITVVSKEEL